MQWLWPRRRRKNEEKKGFEMKISNNFETIRRCNPDRSAKLDGSVSESEIAGGTPRKKPWNHTLRGDRKRAERGKNRAMIPVTQDGGDNGPAEEEDPPRCPPRVPRVGSPLRHSSRTS